MKAPSDAVAPGPVIDEAAAKVLDAHHHLWRLRDGEYRWIKDQLHLRNMAAINRDFEAAEFHSVMRHNGVARSLLVQTECVKEETDQMLTYASHHRFIAGVVGWVDFSASNVAEQIRRRASDPMIKALRIWLLSQQNPEWILSEHLGCGLQSLVKTDLPVEILPRPTQLRSLSRALDLHESLKVALCHAGKPDVLSWRPFDAPFNDWASAMKLLADQGCHVKLSGLVTECGADWTTERIKPYVDTLLGTFGPSRMMWGSDWPVINRAGGYTKWLDAIRELTHHLSTGQQHDLFGQVAARFYGL